MARCVCALLWIALTLPVRARADEPLAPVTAVAPESPPGEAYRSSAAAATIIDAATPLAEGQSAANLIARAPGAVVHAYGGPGQLATLSLRGASSQQVLILLDGVPLTDAASGAVDLATMPAAFLDRIEVIRGTQGALYGPGALGGVVNLVTRAPDSAAMEIEARGGSFDTGEARALATSPLGPGHLLLALDGFGSRGDFPFRPPGSGVDVARDNDDVARTSALARYTVSLDATRALDATLSLEKTERGLAGQERNPTPADRLEETRAIAQLRVTQSTARGPLELRAFARTENENVRLTRVNTAQRESAGGFELRANQRIFHHGISLTLDATEEQLALGQAGFSRPEFGAALGDTWLLAGGRFALMPAVRLDRAGDFSGASPALAATFSPADFVTVRASAGQAFRAPTFFELYVDQGFTAANPNLKSERAYEAELGADFTFDRARFSATAFASEYANLITYELYPPFRAKPFNVGAAGVAGVEFEGGVSLSENLRIDGDYAEERSEDLLDDARYYGHELPYHPHRRGGVTVRRTTSRTTAHAEVFAQSSQFLSRANTAELSGRVDASLGGAVRPFAAQPVWLGLEITNLLDVSSEDLYGYPLPGRAVYALIRVAPEHP